MKREWNKIIKDIIILSIIIVLGVHLALGLGESVIRENWKVNKILSIGIPLIIILISISSIILNVKGKYIGLDVDIHLKGKIKIKLNSDIIFFPAVIMCLIGARSSIIILLGYSALILLVEKLAGLWNPSGLIEDGVVSFGRIFQWKEIEEYELQEHILRMKTKDGVLKFKVDYKECYLIENTLRKKGIKRKY